VLAIKSSFQFVLSHSDAMSAFMLERNARTLYVTQWGKKEKDLEEKFVREVFAPFPKIQDVFIKTFPYGGRSAFITFSHVVEADKAYELAFQSAKKSHNLQLRVQRRTHRDGKGPKPALPLASDSAHALLPDPSQARGVTVTLDARRNLGDDGWRCPDPLCKAVNPKSIENCRNCHCPKKAAKDKQGNNHQEPEERSDEIQEPEKSIVPDFVKMSLATPSPRSPPKTNNSQTTPLRRPFSSTTISNNKQRNTEDNESALQHDVTTVLPKGRGKSKKNRQVNAGLNSAGVGRGANRLKANFETPPPSLNASSSAGTSTSNRSPLKDSHVDSVKELLSKDEKVKLLEVENETLSQKLDQIQSEVARLKAEDFERQLTSLVELWTDLKAVPDTATPDESEESLRLDSARLETIQLLKDVKSLLVLEQDVAASRKAVDSAQKFLETCTAMERCENDPDLKGRLERSTEEARGVLGAKLEKHFTLYPSLALLSAVERRVREFLKNCPCEAGDSLLEGQTTTSNLIGSINRNMNILADSSNTGQVPTGDDEAAGLESPKQAVNRLVEKMAAASALLTSPGIRDHTSTSAPPTTEAGLGLNQCVAAALKAVDREYQIKVLGERPGSDCGRPENDLAGSDLRAALPKILALIKDRDETNAFAVGLNCLNGSHNSHQPIGNDSLEVAEILEGEGR